MIKKLFSLCVLSLLLFTSVQAQSMSDNEVVQYVKSATETGKTQKQIMTELAARGVTRAQAERIKKRYEESQAAGQELNAEVINRQRYRVDKQKVLVEGEMDLLEAEISDPTEKSTQEFYILS